MSNGEKVAGFTEDQISAAARVLADRSAEACNVDKDDNWKIYGGDFIEDARAAIRALASQSAAPVQQAEPLIFDDYPDFNREAMGCGLEDRNITDRYEAMRYGWDEAMERVGERIESFLIDAAPPVQQPGDVREAAPMVAPFTVIELGHGKVEIGDALHDGRLPALWFGKNGQGMGFERVRNERAADGETLAVVTFENVEGLDVLLEVIQRIRRISFPAAKSPALATTRPSAALTDSQCHAIKEAAAINADLWAEGRDVDSTQEEISGMFVHAILAASGGALAVPEGYALVPIDPTVEMMDGAFDNISLSAAHTTYGVTQHVWDYMLSKSPAAPAIPAQGQTK